MQLIQGKTYFIGRNAGQTGRHMVIGDRLKELRVQKDMSQGDIEKRTGLLRCYISRVENGHTVPSVDTLEKMARALEVPMYKLFYDGTAAAEPPKLNASPDNDWGASGRDAETFRQFRTALGKTSDRHRKILLAVAVKLARGEKRKQM